MDALLIEELCLLSHVKEDLARDKLKFVVLDLCLLGLQFLISELNRPIFELIVGGFKDILNQFDALLHPH